jgi:hypothetical protein
MPLESKLVISLERYGFIFVEYKKSRFNHQTNNMIKPRLLNEFAGVSDFEEKTKS